MFPQKIEILLLKWGYIKNEPCDILKNCIFACGGIVKEEKRKNMKKVVLNYFLKSLKIKRVEYPVDR